MNPTTDWASALAILAAGLILGAMVFFASRQKKAASGKRQQLEARRDALVQQLRELGTDAAHEERDALERETAEVLRALDRAPAAKTAEPPASPKRRSAVAAFAAGVGCTLLIGGIAWYSTTHSSERAAEPQAMNVEAQPDEELQRLEQAVRTDPGSADHRIALAKAYFSRNDLMSTFEQTKAVLDANPNEPRALTYNAVVRMAMGELEGAAKMLEQATQLEPTLLDAWVALASARTQLGNTEAAAMAMNTAIARFPQDEQRLREVFAEIQQQGTAPQTAEHDHAHPHGDLPPDHPPLPGRKPAAMAQAQPAAAPQKMAVANAAPGAKPIRVTLDLDPKSAVKSGIIYVIARGAEAGHPVAVRRIEAKSFPVAVELGSGDSMMGDALPPKVRIEARLDSDGDAGTNDPADPRAFADGVPAGATVALTLARTH